MDTTLNAVNAEVLRQLGYISYDEDCMQKVLKYLKKLVAKKEKAEEEEPVMTKEEILAHFAEACQELKLSREGKIKLKTWEELRHELQEEGYLN